jgi:hypothetical protein
MRVGPRQRLLVDAPGGPEEVVVDGTEVGLYKLNAIDP